MEDQALFVRDGDSYVATILTQGGWDPTTSNGGTVLALVGQHLDSVPTLVPMTLSRFTADLVRPVPIGRRLRIRSEVIREGKKIQVVGLHVVDDDDLELARVTALRLRDDGSLDSVVPADTTAHRPADDLVGPEEATSFTALMPEVPGFLRAIDMRRAPTRDGTGLGAWIRLGADVVAGEPTTDTARITYTFDFANLVGLKAFIGEATMINPDVNAHVLRPPTGEWIAITGDTRFDGAIGRGVSDAVLSDDRGVVAVVSTSQLVQRRSG
jgi:hypothetical protein